MKACISEKKRGGGRTGDKIKRKRGGAFFPRGVLQISSDGDDQRIFLV